MSYVNEPFEELDVMNNFMFNQLSTNPKTGKGFVRCLIRNLLGIETGEITIRAENMIYPTLPNKRGVRLDVQIDESNENDNITTIYDIEPHRDPENAFPKKTRFSQAQIDKNTLPSGSNDFSHMPDLYIINITNYDPFGDDYMLYTIKNKCIEIPELVYNDGVTIYYFNTTGTQGGSDDLKKFLEYLETSKSTYASTSATKEMQSYVEIIKHDAEIGGNYLTFGDLMDKVAAEAAAEVCAEKDAIIAEKNASIAEKDASIAEKEAVIAELQAKITLLENK